MELYVLCLLGAGAGTLLLICLVLGHEFLPRAAGKSAGPSRDVRTWVPALLAAVAVAVLTRWPVAGAVVGVAMLLWPRMARGGAIERRSVDKLEALATWTESLRDVATSAAALETAIPLTARGAPKLLQPAVRDLVNCLSVRVPLPESLSRFADDVDDASADLVVAALSLNARQRGGSLRRVLSALADHIRAELTARRYVQKERSAIRRQSQQIAGGLLILVFGQAVFAPGWVAPYGTAAGQVILGVFGACYLLLAIRLQRLSEPEPEPRFLSAPNVVREMASWRPGVIS